MGAGSVELASNRSRRSSILSNLAPNLLSINAVADSILSTICNKVKRTSRERPSPISTELKIIKMYAFSNENALVWMGPQFQLHKSQHI